VGTYDHFCHLSRLADPRYTPSGMWQLRPFFVVVFLRRSTALLRYEQPEGPWDQGVVLRVAGACERNGTQAPCRCEAPEPLLPFRMAQWTGVRAAKPKVTVDSVLIGDSIVYHMKSKVNSSRYLNLGWSSDTAQNMVWRLQAQRPWEDMPRPRVVMIMAGTNNIGNEVKELAHFGEIVQCRGIDDAVCGVRALLGLAQKAWPAATLVLHAVLPRTREETVPERVAPLNSRLQGLVEELNDAVWLDCSKVFLDGTGAPDNALYNDNVHPSPEGYRRWMECLIPQLEALE